MRLLIKTTLYFLMALIPLLAVAGFYLFNQFNRELNERSDKELINDELQWIRYLRTQVDFNETFILKTRELLIYPVEGNPAPYPQITDSYEVNEDNRRMPYRLLSHVVSINGYPYQITIRRSQEQKTALIANITRLMLLVFAGLFIITIGFNWFISKRIWRPFQRSLEKIRGAELPKMEAIRFETSDIKEFQELNTSLNLMIGKIYHDYLNMKEFTENAAHEMQTPLAVVQSKIELLLQDNNLTEEQVDSILQASSSLTRLSKLNQSLLLIAKIENNQYESSEVISLSDVIEKYLQLFDEVIKDKDIYVERKMESRFPVAMHPLLADSLISNLLGNAIKYNYKSGKLFVTVNDKRIEFSNTSSQSSLDINQLFKRFYRTKQGSSSSVGLGLAIVKKIIDGHGLRIDYKLEDGIHRFSISRKQRSK